MAMLNPDVPVLIIEQSAVATPLPSYPWMTHLHVPGRGLSRARNHALCVIHTPFVAFCDDDCLPTPSWIGAMRTAIAAAPDVTVITGSTWPSGAIYMLHAHHTNTGYTTWASRDDDRCCTALHVAPHAADVRHPVPILEVLGQGNNMVVARERALALGGFHPWLGAGAWLHAGEDVEFILRALCAQQRCIYEPHMRLVHDAWHHPDQLARTEHGYTVGMLAVHGWYALRGVAMARAYMVFRFDQLWRTARTTHATTTPTRPRHWRWQRAVAWGHGLLGAVLLTIRAVWRKP